MSSPFFIQSKLGDLVIDIQGAGTKPGTPLDVFTKKTKSPDWNNQLWEFVTSNIEEFYVIQNPASGLVIDVEGASEKPGTPLDAFTMKTSPLGLIAPNQLWAFLPSAEAGYYFVWSNLGNGNLVIDVEGANTKPGTLIDAFTKKTKSPDWDNQLWTFVDEQGKSVTPPVYTTPPVQPPPK